MDGIVVIVEEIGVVTTSVGVKQLADARQILGWGALLRAVVGVNIAPRGGTERGVVHWIKRTAGFHRAAERW